MTARACSYSARDARVCRSPARRGRDQLARRVLSRAYGLAITALFGASILLWTSSCTQMGPTSRAYTDSAEGRHAEHTGHTVAAGHHIAQVLVDGRPVYVICVDPACPVVTRKTLALGGHIDGEVAAAASAAEGTSVGDQQSMEPSLMSVAGAHAVHLEPSNGSVGQAGEATSVGTTSSDGGAKTPVHLDSVLQAEPHAFVGFALNSASLSQRARRDLDRVMPLARTASRIVISGRTDSLGQIEVNQRLAFARALAVREYIRYRIPDARNVIAIDARGACCFIAPNSTADGRSRNRRVEVVFRAGDGA